MSVRVASTSIYVRISCNILTSTSVVVWPNQQVYMLQLLQTRRYVPMLYPTNGQVNKIAPDHHACILQLHLTSSHDFISCILSACMSVTVSSYQHLCILHLHPTTSHVCNNCTWPFPMSLTLASNQQSCNSVNVCLQACMSDRLAPNQNTYL